jgi:hypothetical protein
MSTKFYAENRETGQKWKPQNYLKCREYLVMYDSGYLAVVTEDQYYVGIHALDPKIWKTVIKENMKGN